MLEDEDIRVDCAKAISYLVIKRLVYPDIESDELKIGREEAEEILIRIYRDPITNVLDAIMYQTASEIDNIRATAFSTLSHLASFSSLNKGVLCQISRDIDIDSEDMDEPTRRKDDLLNPDNPD